ncbi:glycosyltransferase (plasmid) [Hymenobacter tibetensis]|uniref:Glycosyltransferase n=1 Tax=Hymenobacter tibetensis TaxID=497967 RepID=A0ABY4D6F3_9BACT|nr:glycosyltransferase [Hymenobacter tibetensis]UOG77604.1 glycosyltransferase [Hymenobacter tibetensis]
MVDISVWITTYNHEEFIAQAIESVLMQQTTFTYELVIGEDCSTDGTRDIVLDYKARYPNKIRLLLPETNLGMVPMTKASYALCTGRYISWLDGDDYWTDPHKLQQQVEFLEAHPTFSLCFHKVMLLNQTLGSETDSGDPAYKELDNTLATKHLIYIYNPVYALSVVHRNVLGDALPDWLFTLPYPDWGFYLALSQYGNAKYLPQPMGVYRIHKGGAYSGQTFNHNASQIIKFFTLVKGPFQKEFGAEIDSVIRYYHSMLFKRNFKQFKLLEAAKHGILRLLR